MEMMKNTCTPSFTSIRASLRSEEVVLNNIALGFYKLNAVVMDRHAYKVSSLCVLPLESLRSEEVNLMKRAYLLAIYCCDFNVGD